MAAEAARVLDYNRYIYGSAAPAPEVFDVPEQVPEEIPVPREQPRQRQRTGTAVQTHSAPRISAFAILGSAVVSILIALVVIAQINYAEVSRETVRLNAQIEALTAQQRKLEIEFESAVDMKEIESYARDVLGMSKPDAGQIAVIKGVPDDRVEVISESNENTLDGFASFLSSLMKYLSPN